MPPKMRAFPLREELKQFHNCCSWRLSDQFWTTLSYVLICRVCIYMCRLWTHLSPNRSCKWASTVSIISRSMVKCLAIIGKHTKVMQVYKHRADGMWRTMVTGTPAAPPTAPTQPRHRRRQRETLPTWVQSPLVLPWMSTNLSLLLITMHNRTLAAIMHTDTMQWHREYSHK